LRKPVLYAIEAFTTGGYPLKTVAVIDTSFETWNLGEEIIMQADNVRRLEAGTDLRVLISVL
jgi:hypothetical protein